MTATIHDNGYELLFRNKTIFRQLIQTFVEEEFQSTWQRFMVLRSLQYKGNFYTRETECVRCTNPCNARIKLTPVDKN